VLVSRCHKIRREGGHREKDHHVHRRRGVLGRGVSDAGSGVRLCAAVLCAGADGAKGSELQRGQSLRSTESEKGEAQEVEEDEAIIRGQTNHEEEEQSELALVNGANREAS